MDARSFNRSALLAAQKLLPANATMTIADISKFPVFNQDLEKKAPLEVVTLKQQIRAADAILFSSPEHNYGISSAMKNAIDWASRPYGDNAFQGKTAGLISASVGVFGGIRGQLALRSSFVFLDVTPLNVPEVCISTAQNKFDQAGNLTDEATKKFLSSYLQLLVDTTSKRSAGNAKL